MVASPLPGRSQHHQPKRERTSREPSFDKAKPKVGGGKDRRAHLLSHSRSCPLVSSASPLPSMPYNVRLATQRKVSTKSSPSLPQQRGGGKVVNDQQARTVSNPDI